MLTLTTMAMELLNIVMRMIWNTLFASLMTLNLKIHSIEAMSALSQLIVEETDREIGIVIGTGIAEVAVVIAEAEVEITAPPKSKSEVAAVRAAPPLKTASPSPLPRRRGQEMTPKMSKAEIAPRHALGASLPLLMEEEEREVEAVAHHALMLEAPN